MILFHSTAYIYLILWVGTFATLMCFNKFTQFEYTTSLLRIYIYICVCVCVFQYASPASKVLPSTSATHTYLVLWIEYSNFWLVCGENDMYPSSLSLCILICITTILCKIQIGKTLTSCKQIFNSIRLQNFHIKYFFKIFSFQNCVCQGKMSDDWLK